MEIAHKAVYQAIMVNTVKGNVPLVVTGVFHPLTVPPVEKGITVACVSSTVQNIATLIVAT